MYIKAQETPMNIPMKQFFTTIMFWGFFVCVRVCSCTNGSRTLMQRVSLDSIPQQLLITFGLDLFIYVPNIFESSIQLCSWYLFHLKMRVERFCSPTYSRRTRQPNFYLVSSINNTRPANIRLTLPWTGTPAIIESGLALSVGIQWILEEQSLSMEAT